MKYADLVIDNKSDQTDRLYTYGCDDDRIGVGSRVRVPFARGNKVRDGYVAQMAEEPDESVKARLKMIGEIDPDVQLTPEIMATAGWMRTR